MVMIVARLYPTLALTQKHMPRTTKIQITKEHFNKYDLQKS